MKENFVTNKLLYFFTNKFHTAPNKSLMNFSNLNQILQLEIFLHQDKQLQAIHIILGFKPISNRFQNPKLVIKAKDPRLALIDVAVPGFLTKPPPFGTQDPQLPTPLATKLLYSHKQPLPFDDEQEELKTEPTK